MKRLRVVQFGISHEHALGKLATIKALRDEFELVGLVDDRDGTSPRYPLRRPDSVLEGVPLLTEEQVWADKTIDAAFVEVTNGDLVATAERVLAHGLPMHLDKPGGETYEPFARFRTFDADHRNEWCLPARRPVGGNIPRPRVGRRNRRFALLARRRLAPRDVRDLQQRGSRPHPRFSRRERFASRGVEP